MHFCSVMEFISLLSHLTYKQLWKIVLHSLLAGGSGVIFTDYYLISVISRFQLSFRSAVQMAVYFSVRNLKTEIPMLFTLVGAIVVIYIFSPSLFFLPAAYAFLMTFSTEKALGGYIREHMKNSGLETMWFMEL